MAATGALILDFDAAVLPLPGSRRLPLKDWQEEVRFGCSMATLARLQWNIGAATGPSRPGRNPTVFTGSGDYHHVSQLLIRAYGGTEQNLQVVVFDNHPDNMRYPFGIHCGSWVWHASRLPFVSCVHVLGITSGDVQLRHAWENHIGPLRIGKVRYWCVGCDLGWTRWLGISGSRSFASTQSMLEAFAGHIQSTDGPLYVSIDKDVLAREEVRTNWDQGRMRVKELSNAIRPLLNRVVGSDITGEVSVYRYQSRFKRLLSGLDGQQAISARDLQSWQLQHQALNRELLCLFQDRAGEARAPGER